MIFVHQLKNPFFCCNFWFVDIVDTHFNVVVLNYDYKAGLTKIAKKGWAKIENGRKKTQKTN